MNFIPFIGVQQSCVFVCFRTIGTEAPTRQAIWKVTLL